MSEREKISQARTILMVTNNYFPYQGGVAQSVDASVRALQARGHNVIVVTLDVGDGKHDDPPHVLRVPSLVRFLYKNNPIAVPLLLGRYLAKIVERVRPAVIHAHHPWLLGYAALRSARRIGCPVVFTHHTMYQEYAHYVPLPEQFTRRWIKRFVRNYCRKVHHIIAPSPAVADMVQAQGITTLCSVVPSAIRESFFGVSVQSKFVSQRPLRLLYVGRLVHEKNVQALFDVLARLSQDLYVFDCVGYGAQWNALHTYAYQTCGLDPVRVKFHHKPDEATLVNWYAQVDLFLFASHTDTQGLVLAEAMACGTPVIALDGPGQRSIIKNGQNGYLVHTVQQMADTILLLAQNLEQGKKLSAGARATAESYTLDAHGQQLEQVYDALW